jgi:uncharacterized protein (DUF3820 family)
MSKNYYEMPYGPWKGQNLYKVVESTEGNTYVAGCMRGLRNDLYEMSNGSWTVPFGKMKGIIFRDLSESWQNYFKTNTQERSDHYSKAMSLVDNNKNSKLTPTDVMDKDQILDLVRDTVGFHYARTSFGPLVSEFRKETKITLMHAVGNKKVPGYPQPFSLFLKDEVMKFVDWVVEKKGKTSYKFF